MSSRNAAALLVVIGVGIINGMGNGTVEPQGAATRAEVSTMLQRMIAIIVQ